MKHTRRNHYRILHVQPEAPAEIITASYRTLMQKLKGHPDLGGDPDKAVLLNQAYAVLSDPGRRRRYDAELARSGRTSAARRSEGTADPEQVRAAARAAGAAAARHAAGRGQAGSGPRAAGTGEGTRTPPDKHACAWCGEPAPHSLRPDSRCRRCDSALSPVRRAQSKHDLFGRRYAQRVARSAPLALFPGYGLPVCGARLRDLSLTGFSALTNQRLAEGRQVRVTDAGMDLLAVVVACRRDGRHWVVHARTTHLVFLRRTGAFVATSA